MRVRTWSACAALAWAIALIMTAAGPIGSPRPAQATTRTAGTTSSTGSTSNTTTTTTTARITLNGSVTSTPARASAAPAARPDAAPAARPDAAAPAAAARAGAAG